jgi:uncharacterized protein YjiS (DUF1127 family)
MKISRTIGNWRRYHTTCRELNRLPQRQLVDIGIFRSDIPAVAKRAID